MLLLGKQPNCMENNRKTFVISQIIKFNVYARRIMYSFPLAHCLLPHKIRVSSPPNPFPIKWIFQHSNKEFVYQFGIICRMSDGIQFIQSGSIGITIDVNIVGIDIVDVSPFSLQAHKICTENVTPSCILPYNIGWP